MRVFMRRCCLAGLVLMALAGCGSSKNKELKPVDLPSYEREVKVKTLWSKSIRGGLGKYYHQFQLAVDNRYIYAASQAGKVYQIDKQTGKTRWRVSLDVPLTTGVAVDQNHVYVGVASGALVALQKSDGQQAWSASLRSELVAPPLVAGKNLLLQASDGTIYNIDADSGEQRWQHVASMPSLTLRGNSRAAQFANFVVFGQASGKLAVLDLDTGELRWDPRVAQAKGDTEIERMVDVDATPVVVEDRLYAVSYQGQLVAYHLASGKLLWAVDESSYQDLAAGLGNIYVTRADAVVNAYDQRSGELKWRQQDLLRRRLTAPATVSSFLALADYKGYIHLLSQVDGRIVGRKRVSNKGVKSNILVDGERFYVIANNGRLKAYRLIARQ